MASKIRQPKETYTVLYARRACRGLELVESGVTEVSRADYVQVASYESVGLERRVELEFQDDFYGQSILHNVHPDIHSHLKQLVKDGETDHMSFDAGDIVVGPHGNPLMMMPMIGWRHVTIRD
jgi:hypothetical protein